VYAPAPPLAQSSEGSASRNHGSRCFTCGQSDRSAQILARVKGC
jgi:hypothetical protein